MNNTLDPFTRLDEQTEYEHEQMIKHFSIDTLPI